TPPTPSMAISTFNTCVGFDFGDLAINATQPNIKWYSNAALTIPVFTSTGNNANPNTDLAISTSLASGTTINRYATQTTSNNCESSPLALSFNVFDNPAKPSASDPAPFCYRQALSAISANGAPGAIYTWFDQADNFILNTMAINLNPLTLGLNTTTVGTSIRKVRQTLNGCISSATSINFTVYAPTPAPTVTSNLINYCTRDTKNAITADGTNLKWYLDVNNLPLLPFKPTGTPDQITQNYSPPINLAASGQANYYVTQTLNGCEGNQVPGEYQAINVTVYQRPTTPTIGKTDYNICNGSAIAAISPNILLGNTVKWYSEDPTVTVTSPIFVGESANATTDLLINNTTVGKLSRYLTNTDNNNGCESTPSLKLTFDVASIEKVTIRTAFNKLDTLCKDSTQNPISLIGEPSAGKFTMFGREIVNLKASDFPVGLHSLVYTYTNNKSDCTVRDSVQLRIMPVPVVNFAISSLCAVKDTISFTNTSTLNGNDNYIDKLKWSFGSSFNSLTPDTVASPKVIYSSAASYPITLQVTTKYPSKASFNAGGCVATSKKPLVYIGNYPNTNFTSRNICAGDSTFFTNTSVNISDVIKTWQWNFGDGDIVTISNTGTGSFGSSKSFGSSSAIKHKYANPGVYIQSLTINTNNNCDSTFSKRSFIVPKMVPIAGAIYKEDFENGNGGFVASDVNSSWQLGTPNKTYIKGGADGSSQAWVTSLSGTYIKGDASYVQCPCFDLSGLTKPMVSLKYKSVLPSNIDGVVLQATDSDINTWVNVGNVVDGRAEAGGLNWYNTGGIQSNPGNQILGQFGWSVSDTTPQWKEAKFKLDNLKDLNGRILDRKTIRFRMAFGSTSLGNKTDGFAFDDFSILERDKKILLEQFTNTSESRSVSSDNNSNAITNANPNDVLAIHYHTSSSPDEFNKLNFADPSARALYYGVDRAPFTVLNGSKFRGESSYIKQLQLDTLALVPSDFVLTPTMQTTGSSVTVNVDVTTKLPLVKDAILNVVVVEREINVTNAANGQAKLEWVMRKMLPDAGGTLITSPMAQNATKSFVFNADLGKIYDSNKLGVIVAIQDKQNKEIFQSAHFGNLINTPTSVSDNYLHTVAVNFFPNPATDVLYIEILNPINEIGTLDFYNLQGQMIKSVSLELNKSISSIDIGDLATGMYVAKLQSKNGNLININRLVVE
ncbi:MAG: T9SS type A sorting domain-containing protein, partial [Cytophagales bacterium]